MLDKADAMTCEHEDVAQTVAAALPARPALSVQTYCHSKTFTARCGVNPLVACAAALFSLLTKLRYTQQYDDLQQLYEDLIHEVQAFEYAALTRHYPADQILAARYVVCASLDEAILRADWGKTSQWQDKTLLAHFQEDITASEQVFAMLERLRAAQQNYLDLIEFFYLCLSLGFEGKYRFIENGRQQLDHIIDDLYRLIRRERGDAVEPLVIASPMRQVATEEKIRLLPISRIAISAVALLSVIYFSFVFMLHMEMQPVQQLLQTITNTSLT